MNSLNFEDGKAGRVLKLIFEKPTYKFHIREMARLTKLNPNTVIDTIKKLSKEGLIKTKKKKHIVELFANVEGKEFSQKKRIFNVNEIYNSGIVDFIIEKLKPKLISVMGGYSGGEDIERSDIDIVVVKKKRNRADLTNLDELGLYFF